MSKTKPTIDNVEIKWSEPGEPVVEAFKGSTHLVESDYCAGTDDIEDAVDTALAMLKPQVMAAAEKLDQFDPDDRIIIEVH